jgi:hypothetical protein
LQAQAKRQGRVNVSLTITVFTPLTKAYRPARPLRRGAPAFVACLNAGRWQEDCRTLRRLCISALLRGVSALAVIGAAMGPGPAFAQVPAMTTTPFDPLAPAPGDERTTKKSPSTYQTLQRGPAAAAASDAPTSFQPPAPAAGAGSTGFDSSNARKRTAKPKTTPDAKAARASQETAPGDPTPAPVSAYQRAVTTPAAAKSAYASGRPGQPPVVLGSPPPLRKKKKKELADPYDPLGVRSGGLVYYPAVELIGGYDSNPSRTGNGGGASLFTVAPELRVRSDWSTHEFKADLRGSYNFYHPNPDPSLDRPYFNGTATGRIDVTHDTRIDLGGRLLVTTDNPNSPNLPAGLAKLPLYTDVGATAGVGQKFNRLDISVKGLIDRTVYQQSELTDGTTASNDDRNYNQYGAAIRAGYEFSPGVQPFVEVGADNRVHDLPVDSSGFQRDSKGYTAMVGSTFELTRMLTGEFAVGYTHRDYQDPALQALGGIIGKGSLLWTATALTTVKFLAASTVQESDQPGVSGILSRDAGVQIDHSLRRWLIGSLKAGIGQDEYVGSPRTDNRYYFGAGLTYKLNRFVQIKGEARHEWLVSTQGVNDYAANVFLLGLRLQY